MKILALEFSSPQRSVAVLDSGAVFETVETRPWGGGPVSSAPSAGGAHALEMIESVLREAKLEPAQIDCLAIGLGPGSYNGIRTAIALAQGWQLARGVKLLGVGSAEAMAAQARAGNIFGRVNIVIDAQRGEFYLAPCEISAGAVRQLEPLQIASHGEIHGREAAGEVLIGPEVTNWFPSGRLLFPHAAALGALARERNDFVPGEKLEPIYLRETKFVKAPPPRAVGME